MKERKQDKQERTYEDFLTEYYSESIKDSVLSGNGKIRILIEDLYTYSKEKFDKFLSLSLIHI